MRITKFFHYLAAGLTVCFLLNSMSSETRANPVSPHNNSLDAPSDLSVEQADGVVTLSWTNNGGTGKNLIERRSSTEEWRQIGEVEADEDTFDDESTEADGTYTYRVRNASEKGYSNEAGVSFKTNAEAEPESKPAPSKPQNAAPNPAEGWKKPEFRFKVEIPDLNTSFMVEEVSGLDIEAQIIEYRAGNSKEFSVQKMPGIKKISDITLKKGIFAKDNKLFEWYGQIKLGQIQKKTIIVKLLDEEGKPTMVWTLANAWPTKITGSFESVVIVHEGLTIANK